MSVMAILLRLTAGTFIAQQHFPIGPALSFLAGKLFKRSRGLSMSHLEVERRFSAISWGSVIAGVLTVLAVSMLLSLLSSAFGLGMVDAKAADPLSGVGSAFGWSSAIFLLISLAAGGYLAGYLSGAAGWVHGFLTWALALLIAAYLSVSALSGALNITGSVISGAANVTGTAASAAGQAVGGLGQAVGSGVSALAERLEGTDLNLDGDDTLAQLRRAAQQANLEALQPRLIEQELSGAREDVTNAAQDLASNPTNYEAIGKDLIDQLRGRVEKIRTEINRDDVVEAIAQNTTLTETEVQQAADRAIGLYNGIATRAGDQLDAIERNVTAAQERLVQLKAQAIEQADVAAAAAAKASLWGFFGALLGAVIATLFGALGARSPLVARRY